MSLALEATKVDEATAFDNEDDSLPDLECEHRAAGAAASRATDEVTKATMTLKTLKRRLAKITPHEHPKMEPKSFNLIYHHSIDRLRNPKKETSKAA